MVNVSIWSTIEQSIGIICACLITYRPLFGRMCSAYHNTIEKPAMQSHPSKTGEMPNLRSKASGRTSDASAAGFARLYEDDFESGVTTHVTAIRTPGFSAVPKAIMKDQTIELHHSYVSDV